MGRGNNSFSQFSDRSSILAGATDELRPLIEKLGVEIELDAGQVIFNQGDAGDALYMVEAGAVEISVVSLGGRKLSLNVMRPCDVFGEIALIDARTRTASATALQPTKLRCVRRDDLFAALRTRADLAFDFIQLLCDRLRWVSDLLEDRAFLPLPVRLAKRLLFLVEQMGDEKGSVPVSQGDLADFVSATREGVSKALAIWRRRGWVDLSRGTVTIIDRAALEGVAGALDE